MSKYLIDDSRDILIPSLSDFFALWLVDNDVNSLIQLDDYAKENGVEKLKYTEGWMQGLVDADLFRPYILVLGNQIYIGLHIMDSGRLPLNQIGRSAGEVQLFNNYINLSRLIRDKLLPSGQRVFGRYYNDYFDEFKNSTAANFFQTSHQFSSEVLNTNSTAKSINNFIIDNPMSMKKVEEVFKPYLNNNYNNWGTMLYATCGDSNNFFRPMQDKDSSWIKSLSTEQAVQRYLNGLSGNQSVTHYQLTGGSVCWGDQKQEHYAYYIDELMGFEVLGKIPYLNWMENPIAKETKSYLIQVEEERQRLKELERFNRISAELQEHTKENVRAEIRLHNQLMNQRKGKVTDGIYFDSNKIKYLLTKYRLGDKDIYPEALRNWVNNNQRFHNLYSTIQQIPSYLSNHNNPISIHKTIDKFMITLFGKDYNLIPYNNQSDYNNYINSRGNRSLKIHWCDPPTPVERLATNEDWFDVLMNSGLNLSEYIVDDLTYQRKKVEIKNDTLAFNFMKPKGKIMKSKLYKDIKLGLERMKDGQRFSGVFYQEGDSLDIDMGLFIFPKWMFIKYVGGKEVDF